MREIERMVELSRRVSAPGAADEVFARYIAGPVADLVRAARQVAEGVDGYEECLHPTLVQALAALDAWEPS